MSALLFSNRSLRRFSRSALDWSRSLRRSGCLLRPLRSTFFRLPGSPLKNIAVTHPKAPQIPAQLMTWQRILLRITQVAFWWLLFRIRSEKRSYELLVLNVNFLWNCQKIEINMCCILPEFIQVSAWIANNCSLQVLIFRRWCWIGELEEKSRYSIFLRPGATSCYSSLCSHVWYVWYNRIQEMDSRIGLQIFSTESQNLCQF